MVASNKPVAIVTGAGSGIGQATVIMLGERGYRVVLIGRRISRLLNTAELLPKGVEHLEVVADVGHASHVSAMIEQAVAYFGRLDVLVNNAGFAPMMPIDQTQLEALEEIYRVNALAPAYAIVKAWPIFKRQNAIEKTGSCIINISTLGTVDPFPGFFAYASAKAAVNLMVKSCAKEGKEIGVRAFAVAPGLVETEMLRALFTHSEVPAANCLSPAEVAKVVIECVTGLRDHLNGETILLPGPMVKEPQSGGGGA